MSDKSVLHRAFSEVYNKTPKTVVKAKKKGMAKRKMLIAIALSKARRAGARIPSAVGSELPITGSAG